MAEQPSQSGSRFTHPKGGEWLAMDADIPESVVPCDATAMTRAVNAALAEMLRLLAADDFDDEREGDESPERFVARKAMEAGFRAAGETP